MTQVINLADLKPEAAVVIVEDDDTRHEMKPATVQSFMDNVALVEGLGTNASVQEEMEVMIKIVIGAFPTLSDEKIREWPLEYLQGISNVAQSQNGEVVTTDEDKAKEAKEAGNDSRAI